MIKRTLLALLASCAPAAVPPTSSGQGSAPTPRTLAPSASLPDARTSTPTLHRLSPPRDAFYSKELDDGAIRILAHASVSDEAMLVAQAKLERLLARAPRIRRNLEAAEHELHVIGLRQFASDLPEHRGQRGSTLDNGQIFDWHMIGGHIVGRFSSCTEATLLDVVGHRLYGDDTCTHELAHAVELVAMDADARARVRAAYEASMSAGLWKGEYAAKNEHEWFAEITRMYFRDESMPPKFYDARPSKGRTWLCGYDAAACKLAEAVYSDAFDPGTRVIEKATLRPGRDESALKSGSSRASAQLWVENHGAEKIRVVWIDFAGKRDSRAPFEKMPAADPAGVITMSSFATHAFAITNDAGAALCTFVVGERDTRVDYRGSCN
jgi:hypothetical protein